MKGKTDTVKFEDDLIERLKNPKFAAYFLSEILNDSSPGKKERVLTKKIGRSPKALYVSLAKGGNPTLETFFAILDALGIQLSAKASRTSSPVPQEDDAA